MRTAIIGCGNIAQVHAKALNSIKDIEIVAFADCKQEKAQIMSEKYTDGAAAVFEDYKEMLDSVSPDVVHICTPHYLHVPMAIEALKRDISVFMEKPPAISIAEFDKLKDVCKKSSGKIGFCFQNRYNPTTKAIDSIIDNHEMGNITGARAFVTWRRDAGYYSDEWHGSLEKEGGGVLINQSIHTLDLLLRYMGRPIRIAASMNNHHLRNIIEVEDTFEAWMEFEKGQRAVLYATTAYSEDATIIMELSFENGRVMMIDKMIYVYPNGKETKMINCEFDMQNCFGKSYWGNGHLACIRDFYDCIIQGKKYQNDIDGVSNTLYTTIRLYEEAEK